MPRAKSRCSKAGCYNFKPCSIKAHRRGWDSDKSEPLPSNWASLKRLVKQRSGGRCEVEHSLGPMRRRCGRPGSAVDHIINRARWPKGQPGMNGFHPDVRNPKNNLQHICASCHKLKTDMERKGQSWIT